MGIKTSSKQKKLKVDKESDALYFGLDEAEICESEEVQSGIIFDFDSQERIIGIEFLEISKRFSAKQLGNLQCEIV